MAATVGVSVEALLTLVAVCSGVTIEDVDTDGAITGVVVLATAEVISVAVVVGKAELSVLIDVAAVDVAEAEAESAVVVPFTSLVSELLKLVEVGTAVLLSVPEVADKESLELVMVPVGVDDSVPVELGKSVVVTAAVPVLLEKLLVPLGSVVSVAVKVGELVSVPLLVGSSVRTAPLVVDAAEDSVVVGKRPESREETVPVVDAAAEDPELEYSIPEVELEAGADVVVAGSSKLLRMFPPVLVDGKALVAAPVVVGAEVADAAALPDVVGAAALSEVDAAAPELEEDEDVGSKPPRRELKRPPSLLVLEATLDELSEVPSEPLSEVVVAALDLVVVAGLDDELELGLEASDVGDEEESVSVTVLEIVTITELEVVLAAVEVVDVGEMRLARLSGMTDPVLPASFASMIPII